MHRNPKNTQNTDDFLCSGMKLLLPTWLLGFSTRGEKDTISTMLTVPSDLTMHHIDPTGLALPRLENQLASPRSESQLTPFFQQSPKILSPSLPGMTSFTPQSHFLSGVFIMTSVIVTPSSRECEHLRSMCVPACALSRIVLSLTKPNDNTKNDNIKKIIPQLYNITPRSISKSIISSTC